MSSPFTSLNKYRKLPLSKPPIMSSKDGSCDENTISNPSVEQSHGYRYEKNDAKLLDEVTSRMAKNNRKANSDTNDSGPRVPTDLDLLQLTMNRMQKAESDTVRLTNELREKMRRIAVLEEKVHLYEKALKSQSGESYKIQVLENKCARLQSIIDRMEDLLIERGLEIVGGLDEPDNVNILTFDEADRVELQSTHPSKVPVLQTWKPEESLLKATPVDFNAILDNIRELNLLAGESEVHFEPQDINNQPHISTLKRTKRIHLTLYANGIFLLNGPFRPFSDPSTKQFIRDILDGYFPSELQQYFPNGVPFEVSDKRDIYFTDERKQRAFQGEGYVLCDSRVVNNNASIDDSLSVPVGAKTESGPKIPLNQFLNRLPQSIIKNGQVINVRQEIEQRLTKDKQDPIVRYESAISESRSDIDSGIPLSTLRIRSHDGQQTYVIKMKTSCSIKDVKQTIAKKKKLQFDFDLFAMGTKLLLTNEDKTLEQCGLVPNATLCIREKRQN